MGYLESDDADEILSRQAATRCYVSEQLGTQWTRVRGLYCDQLERVAAPGIDTATLTYHYGLFAVKDGGGDPGYYPPQEDLDRQYVKVEILSGADVDGATVRETWYGIIEIDQRAAHGTRGNSQSGDQTFVAYGLLRELEREIVRSSVVESGEGEFQTIKRGLTFNPQVGVGYTSPGNRSEEKGEYNGYIFAAAAGDEAVWSAEQIVRYMLEHHEPKDAFGAPTAEWEFSAPAKLLDWYDVGPVPTDRRSVKSILDDVIDRRRLCGYYVQGLELADAFKVQVVAFGFSDVPIPVGRTTIPENDNPQTLDFAGAFDVDAIIRRQSTQAVDLVRVEGNWITSIFTLKIGDGLETAWSSELEEEYLAGGSAEAGYGDLDVEDQEELNGRARQRDEFRNVYSLFRLQEDFEGKPAAPLSEDVYYIALNTKKLDDIETGDITAATAVDGNPSPSLWMTGKPFLRTLPVLDDGNEYLAPFVLFKTEEIGDADEDLYELGDKLSANAGGDGEKARRWSVSLGIDSEEPAVHLKVSGAQQQFIAKADWTAGTPAATSAYDDPEDPDDLGHNALDYDGAFVTLAVETDDRLAVEKRRSGPKKAGRQERVEIIRVPDARLDVRIPGTITGVDAGGRLVADETGSILRDDRPRLEDIAEAAIAWYGRARQALSISWKQVDPHGLQVGHLLTNLGDDFDSEIVRAAVTGVRYDLVAGSTTIDTDYGELDFG